MDKEKAKGKVSSAETVWGMEKQKFLRHSQLLIVCVF
jgi:hypothetical protein